VCVCGGWGRAVCEGEAGACGALQRASTCMLDRAPLRPALLQCASAAAAATTADEPPRSTLRVPLRRRQGGRRRWLRVPPASRLRECSVDSEELRRGTGVSSSGGRGAASVCVPGALGPAARGMRRAATGSALSVGVPRPTATSQCQVPHGARAAGGRPLRAPAAGPRVHRRPEQRRRLVAQKQQQPLRAPRIVRLLRVRGPEGPQSPERSQSTRAVTALNVSIVLELCLGTLCGPRRPHVPSRPEHPPRASASSSPTPCPAARVRRALRCSACTQRASCTGARAAGGLAAA